LSLSRPMPPTPPRSAAMNMCSDASNQSIRTQGSSSRVAQSMAPMVLLYMRQSKLLAPVVVLVLPVCASTAVWLLAVSICDVVVGALGCPPISA
jgi:hypothetical protein